MRPRMLTPRYLGALTATACLALCLVPAGAGARGPCALRPMRTRLIHHLAPPQSFLSSLAVLRRPQTPADLQGFDVNAIIAGVVNVPGIEEPELALPSVIDADYIRRLGSVGGEPGFLIPARVQLVAPISRRCLRRLSVKARRLQLKLERADRARGVVLLFAGAIVTYSELIGGDAVVTSSGPPPMIPGLPPGVVETPASVTPEVEYGIVPDGVSSVTLLSENNPPITTQVTTNFLSIEVSPSFHHGQATLVWRDASGHTLKSLPERAIL
jgi:hypothetical protein